MKRNVALARVSVDRCVCELRAGELEPVFVKIAVTLWSAFMTRTPAPTPEHAPLQPANVEPLLAVAINDTGVVSRNIKLHAEGQVVEPSLTSAVPLPVPPSEMVRRTSGSWLSGIFVKVAVTAWFEVIVISQALRFTVPGHVPSHPANVEPTPEVAGTDTAAPEAYHALQSAIRLNDAVESLIVPVPLPANATASIAPVLASSMP